ncbi:MAG: LysM peptidoglycan-binding domain-containing protein, partial [Ectothiorhodospiraceae bacterium]
HIVDQVQSRGMPTEIALLPIVESAFRPFAYSHGRAAGIWQFVPSTGKHFGLKQNWWYDGRRDVIAATDAALDYLSRLHDMFDGDWLLAIAAYNAGEGNVLNAVKRNRRRGRPTDFWHLDLPRETETYVPRLLGLRDLVRSPEAHGISLPSIPNEPRIEAVKVDSQLDLALAADLAGISIERLYQLNPGYNRWATAPSGPHRIVLPVGRVDQFEQGLEATPTEKRVRWRRHKIARGETLIQIARRYHTTVKVIRDVNGIHGNTIRAGHHLVVPMASRPSDAYSLSKSQRLAALQGRSRSGQKHVHVVKRGDTLWGIARRYGVSVRTLGRWNRMAPGDTLRPGQRLVIWTKGGVTPVAAGSSVPGNRIQSVRYTVRSGDSLYRIAQRFNVKVSDLRRWNNIARGRYLQPGQKLRLKVDVTRQSGI